MTDNRQTLALSKTASHLDINHGIYKSREVTEPGEKLGSRPRQNDKGWKGQTYYNSPKAQPRVRHRAPISNGDSGDVQESFLFNGMKRISKHKEINTSNPSTGEVFRRLVRKIPKHQITLNDYKDLDKWVIGIKEEIETQESGYKSFHLAAKSFIFECLDNQARRLCEAKLSPENTPFMSVDDYLTQIQRTLEHSKGLHRKRYVFFTNKTKT